VSGTGSRKKGVPSIHARTVRRESEAIRDGSARLSSQSHAPEEAQPRSCRLSFPRMSVDPSPLIPLSWRPQEPLDAHGLRAALAPVLSTLTSRGLAPVHIRLYAAPNAAALAVAETQAVCGPRQPVVTVVTANPCAGGEVAGAHVLAVRADLPTQPIFDGARRVGARIGSTPPVVFLAGLTAPHEGSAEDEFTALFEAAERLLSPFDMTFTDVARTWLHLPELLRDYDALNAARGAFFTKRGIGSTVAPPASTGIQGGSRDSARLQIDLVATAPSAFRPVVATLQCEAWDYGSAFSRGMALGSNLVTISGTASIDADGSTIHLDDPAQQIRATWSTVRDLLQAESLRFPSSGSQAWVLYFKTPSVWHAWRELVDSGEVVEPDYAVCVYADVCRDNLLFEMELTAGR